MHRDVFRTSDGCPIAYTVKATPNSALPRLVLIHSLALDASIWDGVVAKLSGHFDVLTYDCRGHGRSGRRVERFTTELFARDLAELLDHIGWQTVLAAGCSMGGCVSQAFAGLYPSRATGLGLIDTTAWYGDSARQEWSERATVARTKGFSGMIEFQIPRWFGDHFPAAHPDLVKAATDVFLANDIGCYTASCSLLGDADLRSYLPSLRVPAAVIVGEEDFATPVAMARHLHEAIPNSTLTILPGARHLTPIECPDQIAAQLLALQESI